MSGALVEWAAAIARARGARRRQAVAEAMLDAGVEAVRVDGEAVRLSGRGLMRRWMSDLSMREAGRGRA